MRRRAELKLSWSQRVHPILSGSSCTELYSLYHLPRGAHSGIFICFAAINPRARLAAQPTRSRRATNRYETWLQSFICGSRADCFRLPEVGLLSERIE